MAKCPKCGKRISKNTTKCPYCHKLISHKNFNKDIQVKPIPLKVKPVKEAKEIKKTKKVVKKRAKEQTNLQYPSTFNLFLIVSLILINLILVLNIINQFQNEEPIPTINNEHEKFNVSSLGSWQSEKNNLFIFGEDNIFYWYDSYLKLNDNYYTGTYNYKNGLEALKEMGYTEDEFYKTFGEDVKIDNVYSINLFPTKSIKNGKDFTNNDLNDNETWWFLLIIKNEQTALGYNKTLDLKYTFSRY